MAAHPLAQLLEQLEVAPLEQHLRGMQMAPVFGAVDRQTARPEASLDLVFDTRARAILETASEQVRSGKTLRMTSIVSRKPSAEPERTEVTCRRP